MDPKEENLKLKIELQETKIELYYERLKRYFKLLEIISDKLDHNLLVEKKLGNTIVVSKEDVFENFYYTILDFPRLENEFLMDDTDYEFSTAGRNVQNERQKSSFLKWCQFHINKMGEIKTTTESNYEKHKVEIEIAKRELKALREKLINLDKATENVQTPDLSNHNKTENLKNENIIDKNSGQKLRKAARGELKQIIDDIIEDFAEKFKKGKEKFKLEQGKELKKDKLQLVCNEVEKRGIIAIPGSVRAKLGDRKYKKMSS